MKKCKKKIATGLQTPAQAFASRTTYPEPALRYIEKYWLPDSEYIDIWEKKQISIFKMPVNYPDHIFNDSFTVEKLVGGLLFEEREFDKLKKLMKYAGDKNFVLCEDADFVNHESDIPPIRLKFPSDIDWDILPRG